MTRGQFKKSIEGTLIAGKFLSQLVRQARQTIVLTDGSTRATKFTTPHPNRHAANFSRVIRPAPLLPLFNIVDAEINMRISVDRQLELFNQHSEGCIDLLVDILQTRGPELVALAKTRAFKDVGVHEYGDSTYWLDNKDLEDELLAELADAVFYMQVVKARSAGDLPDINP